MKKINFMDYVKSEYYDIDAITMIKELCDLIKTKYNIVANQLRL